MKFLKNESEIKNVINGEDGIKAVQLIMGDNEEEICMVISTEMFSTPYLIPYNKRQFVYDELWDTKVKLFLFTDKQLTEAWKDSYTKGGIEQERWDRRTIFHPYNQMNEMFCMGDDLLDDITGKWIGTPWELTEDKCAWKYHMIEWYKTKLMN